ncbi:mediator of RNA polymerase II transcription subunit 15a-like [Triticum aestivum]|uniref:mediator of RNA polymerase II transcription subunit 15a-like n=1 Tax=Triticum aestivum TaxID=4565 RepID=UPI001D014B21|nr:mediator of RNA polymerase II transcription subunit 15a-like [Triticum aestivum]
MAEGGQQAHPAAGGDGGRWLAAAPPNLRAKVVQKITNNLCQFQVQGNQLDQLHAVASRFEAKVFSDSHNVQDYLRTISIKMMTLQSKWQPAASDHQAHTGGQVRPLNAVPAYATAVPPPQASPSTTTRLAVRPPQAQNMQLNHKPSQQPPMAPVAQLHPCDPTVAAQIQTQSLSRHHNSSGMCTRQPVAQAPFNHQPHMPPNAVTQIQTAVPRLTSANRLPPTDQVQNMGINPMAPTGQLHPCHPTAVTQIQSQSMARHNSSGMRAQEPQQDYLRVNQRQSYQAQGGQQSNVGPLQIGPSGERNNQQFGHHPVEVDWREDMFQRITSLKVAHFSELVEFQRAIQARIPQRITNQQLESLPKEQADKYRKLVDTMAKIGSALSFLQLQKSNIPEAMKDQFDKHQIRIDRILHFHRVMKDRLQNPPRAVNNIGATGSQQKHQEQPAAETSFSQSSENVPATSLLVQQQENSHDVAGEEAVHDEVRREAEAPVATNLTGSSTPPLTSGSGTCSQEKEDDHHPAYEAIPQLTQNANPVETPPAHQQTNRSLSPAALRSLAQDMGVNLKRAFRHTMSGSCAWFDESSGDSCNKRRKMHALRDEIRAAYSMLVETEIRITDDDTGGADGAVVIELCYIPVSLTPDLREVIDPSEMSTKLLVPADYPRSSPVHVGDDGGHRKGIAAGVLDVEFRRALGQLPEPRSIKGIAKAWDACVRRAVVQFAHGLGGGTFSTRYGRWESCIGA